MYGLKKDRDDIKNELSECCNRVLLLEKIVGYKLKNKIICWNINVFNK